MPVTDKQDILEINDLQDRAIETLKQMNIEFKKLEIKNDIQSKVQTDLSQQQREFFLHQQMKTIQEELGGVSHDSEIDEMKKRSKKKKWNNEIKKHFDKNMNFEYRLKISGKTEMIKELNPAIFSGIKFHYIDQKEQNGLGHAILQAQEAIGDHSFAVLLPDDLFFSEETCLDQLLNSYQETNSSVIAVNKIGREEIFIEYTSYILDIYSKACYRLDDSNGRSQVF